jgi:hypothetical protein
MRTVLLILLLVPMMSFGQLHTIDNYNITLTDNSSVNDFYGNTYYNALDSVEVSWQIVANSMPNNWAYSICFPTCYPIGVDNSNSNFNIDTQQYLNCHFYPNNTAGTGVIKMQIITHKKDDDSFLYVDTVTWTAIATNSLHTNELNNTPKQLIKIVDIQGRETPFKPNTPLLYIYNDGTVERKMIIKQ